MCVSDCMIFKIRVGRSGFFFFETYKHALSSKITQTCLFVSILQLINYLTCSTMFLVPNIDQMYRRKLLKLETNTETETNFRILTIYFFFFGIKNVRVGGKILESVGRSETNLFLFWPNVQQLPVTEVNNINNNYMYIHNIH